MVEGSHVAKSKAAVVNIDEIRKFGELLRKPVTLDWATKVCCQNRSVLFQMRYPASENLLQNGSKQQD